MISTRLSLLLLCLLLPVTTRAQEDDAPIPYPDEDERSRPTTKDGLRELPRSSDQTPDLRDDYDIDDDPRELRLARQDDPNVGIGLEVLGGLLLLDSSRGTLAEPAFAWGARFNWELGRVVTAQPFREALFLDVTWAYGSNRGGTQRIFTDSRFHYFTLAPAWELHVGSGYDYGFYGQLGGGAAYQVSALNADGTEHTVGALKPVFQYGLGFRGRPRLGGENPLRISFRVEVTRFLRQYMHDTLIAGTVGVSF